MPASGRDLTRVAIADARVTDASPRSPASHFPHRADRHQLAAPAALRSGWCCPPRTCSCPSPGRKPSRVASARVWPAPEYTRVIVESNAPLAHQLQVLRNPDRLVLDIDGVDARQRARANCRRACSRRIRTSRRSALGRARRGGHARRARPQGRGEARRLRAEAGRRIRPSPGARPVSRWCRSIR